MVVETALETCARVVLVTGYRGAELARVFKPESRVTTVANPDWELGMFSSIRTGARLLTTGRFFICLGDMPFLEAGVYRALLETIPADTVFPVFDGRRGHPVLFHERVRRAVEEENAAGGSMKSVVERFTVRELPWPDDSILRDVDTPNDLSRL